MTERQITELENQLNDFDPGVRAAALDELLALAKAGKVELAQEQPVANMHCHTFFSFNAYGYSPTALVWLAKRRGYKLMGTVDFDVLDAVDEFLDACEKAGVRGSAGMETRTFVPEFATREMNSPGEPGVYYHMGIGFTSSAIPEEASAIAADLRTRAAARNRDVMVRVNAHLAPVVLDYERDVIPRSPGRNPTERHMVAAYVEAAARTVADPAAFWAEKLSMPADDVAALMQDMAKFQNTLRAKLIKRGGVGYVTPSYDTFPSVDTVNEMVLACGALPCATWLDGLSQGEQDIEELLDLMIRKGAVALNIVPDRNWNIADPDTKKVKLQNLYDIVDLAQKLDLPLNSGTEMNSFGQKHIDDFDAPELAPVKQAILDGASFVYGHTALQRAQKLGYHSAWAQAYLPSRRARNDFYTHVGYHLMPGKTGAAVCAALHDAMSPADVLAKVKRD